VHPQASGWLEQLTQGIIEKGLSRLEWRPHYANIQIVQAFASEVGNLSVLQVKEQGISSCVTSERIFLGGAKLHFRSTTIVVVYLLTQVDKIQVQAEGSSNGSLEFFLLVEVLLGCMKAVEFLELDSQVQCALPVGGFILLKELCQKVAELHTSHGTESDIQVGTGDAQKSISHPATSYPYLQFLRHRLLSAPKQKITEQFFSWQQNYRCCLVGSQLRRRPCKEPTTRSRFMFVDESSRQSYLVPSSTCYLEAPRIPFSGGDIRLGR
jgi:hypothetical protein